MPSFQIETYKQEDNAAKIVKDAAVLVTLAGATYYIAPIILGNGTYYLVHYLISSNSKGYRRLVDNLASSASQLIADTTRDGVIYYNLLRSISLCQRVVALSLRKAYQNITQIPVSDILAALPKTPQLALPGSMALLKYQDSEPTIKSPAKELSEDDFEMIDDK